MSTLEKPTKLRLQVYGFDGTAKNKLKAFAKTEGFKSVSDLVSYLLLQRLENVVFDDKKEILSSDTGRFRFQVRFTEEDGATFLHQVKTLGYNSPARYAKSILLNHIKKTTVSPISIEQRNVLHESNAKLERIGRNINQIARQYNTDPYLAKDILTVDMLASLSKMIENHCTVVGHILAENQSVFDK
jgi:hypothetical protein